MTEDSDSCSSAIVCMADIEAEANINANKVPSTYYRSLFQDED